MSEAATKSVFSRLRGAAVFVLVLYAAYLIMLTAIQSFMMYPGAYANLAPKVASPPAGVEVMHVETEPAIRVEAWYFPNAAVTPAPAVIITHGNYEVIDDGVYHANQFVALGCAVLLAEYRGYGRSGGKPSEAGITRDLTAMYDWLAERPDVDRRRIAVYGRSIGAAAVAQLARVRPVAAMVLESPFVSMDAMAARYLAPAFLIRDHWRTDEALREVQRPLLLIHGRHDDTIPIAASRKLQSLVPAATLLEYDGGHTDLAGGNSWLYWSAVLKHLKSADVLP